ncbi:HAD family hydrolase [Candidatus Omnitrophota bacterium]
MSGRYSSKPKAKKDLTIYLDLDGPLIDFSERSYRAYRDSLEPKQDERPLKRAAYWRRKRSRYALEEIYKASGGRGYFGRFKRGYLRRIEAPVYLKFDRLNKNALEFLKRQRGSKVVLVTLRRNRRNLIQELNRFKIKDYFDAILSRPNRKEAYKEKIRLISAGGFFNKRNSVIIGDTEADILAGRYLRIKAIAVLSGIRSLALLKRLKPLRIVRDLGALKTIDGEIS